MQKEKILLIAVMLVLPLQALSVPNYLTHQGHIIDSTNSPLTGIVEITFSIYDADENGTVLWSEAIDVSFDNGYYTVWLGLDSENALPEDSFNGDARFLSVALGDGEMLPRISVTSVPYALLAAKAEMLSGPVDAIGGISVDGSEVVNSDGIWTGGEVKPSSTGLECSGDSAGALRWNADDGALEVCDGDVWSVVYGGVPIITSIEPNEGSELGGYNAVIQGTNFKNGSIVKFGTVVAESVQFDSTDQLTVVIPVLEPATYNVTILTPSGVTGDLNNGWTSRADEGPVWQTAEGLVATTREDYSQFSVSLSATDAEDDPLTYSVVSGNLPDGIELNENTGELSGDPTDVDSETTSTFTIRATSTFGEVTQYEDRQFSIVVRDPVRVAFDYTGSDQTWTIPDVNSDIWIKMWGAGGGGGDRGGWSYGYNAGAGGYAEGKLTESAGQELTIIVGQGGIKGSTNVTNWLYGGGACHQTTSDNRYGGCGGGRSEVRLGSTSLIIAGGGGGGGSSTGNENNFGGAGGGLEGQEGNTASGTNAGGGTQDAGGAAGTGGNSGEAGSQYRGGRSASNAYGGGGGGGWYGGGGGNYTGGHMAGGGGGSSYIDGVENGNTVAGDQTTTGNEGDSDRSGAGTACGVNCTGGNGRIVIVY